MSNIDWGRLPVFLKVVETESITRAAESLRLPKSSVSRTVSALERELETQLLLRTTRHVKLTEAGRRFYERAKAARAALEEAAAELEHRTDDAQGLVRVTVAPTGWAFADLFMRFLKLHPHVRLEVIATNRQVNLVEEGVDLAIRAGAMPDSSLVARKISTSDLVLVASREYLAKHGVPRRLDELKKHQVVLFRGKSGAGVLTLTGPKGPVEVAVTGSTSADDLGFVQAFVRLGAGIGLLPVVMLNTPPSKQGPRDLVHVLPEYRVAGSGIHVVMPASRYVPTRVRLLVDFLAAEMKETQLCEVARALSGESKPLKRTARTQGLSSRAGA